MMILECDKNVDAMFIPFSSTFGVTLSFFKCKSKI